MSKRSVLTAAVFAFGGALAASTLMPTSSAVAQTTPGPAHPEMSNVIPDGGGGGIEGKIQKLDPRTRIVEIAPKTGHALQLYVSPHIRLDDLETGDEVDALYTRNVLWVVTPAKEESLGGPATKVGEVAHAPGGVGPWATQINGRVTKIDSTGHRFDLVDGTGGGVYTIVVTDPARYAMMDSLQVGSGLTVMMSPLTITALEKCGWFGCL